MTKRYSMLGGILVVALSLLVGLMLPGVFNANPPAQAGVSASADFTGGEGYKFFADDSDFASITDSGDENLYDDTSVLESIYLLPDETAYSFIVGQYCQEYDVDSLVVKVNGEEIEPTETSPGYAKGGKHYFRRYQFDYAVGKHYMVTAEHIGFTLTFNGESFKSADAALATALENSHIEKPVIEYTGNLYINTENVILRDVTFRNTADTAAKVTLKKVVGPYVLVFEGKTDLTTTCTRFGLRNYIGTLNFVSDSVESNITSMCILYGENTLLQTAESPALKCDNEVMIFSGEPDSSLKIKQTVINERFVVLNRIVFQSVELTIESIGNAFAAADGIHFEKGSNVTANMLASEDDDRDNCVLLSLSINIDDSTLTTNRAIECSDPDRGLVWMENSTLDMTLGDEDSTAIFGGLCIERNCNVRITDTNTVAQESPFKILSALFLNDRGSYFTAKTNAETGIEKVPTFREVFTYFDYAFENCEWDDSELVAINGRMGECISATTTIEGESVSTKEITIRPAHKYLTVFAEPIAIEAVELTDATGNVILYAYESSEPDSATIGWLLLPLDIDTFDVTVKVFENYRGLVYFTHTQTNAKYSGCADGDTITINLSGATYAHTLELYFEFQEFFVGKMTALDGTDEDWVYGEFEYGETFEIESEDVESTGKEFAYWLRCDSDDNIIEKIYADPYLVTVTADESYEAVYVDKIYKVIVEFGIENVLPVVYENLKVGDTILLPAQADIPSNRYGEFMGFNNDSFGLLSAGAEFTLSVDHAKTIVIFAKWDTNVHFRIDGQAYSHIKDVIPALDGGGVVDVIADYSDGMEYIIPDNVTFRGLPGVSFAIELILSLGGSVTFTGTFENLHCILLDSSFSGDVVLDNINCTWLALSSYATDLNVSIKGDCFVDYSLFECDNCNISSAVSAETDVLTTFELSFWSETFNVDNLSIVQMRSEYVDSSLLYFYPKFSKDSFYIGLSNSYIYTATEALVLIEVSDSESEPYVASEASFALNNATVAPVEGCVPADLILQYNWNLSVSDSDLTLSEIVVCWDITVYDSNIEATMLASVIDSIYIIDSSVNITEPYEFSAIVMIFEDFDTHKSVEISNDIGELDEFFSYFSCAKLDGSDDSSHINYAYFYSYFGYINAPDSISIENSTLTASGKVVRDMAAISTTCFYAEDSDIIINDYEFGILLYQAYEEDDMCKGEAEIQNSNLTISVANTAIWGEISSGFLVKESNVNLTSKDGGICFTADFETGFVDNEVVFYDSTINITAVCGIFILDLQLCVLNSTLDIVSKSLVYSTGELYGYCIKGSSDLFVIGSVINATEQIEERFAATYEGDTSWGEYRGEQLGGSLVTWYSDITFDVKAPVVIDNGLYTDFPVYTGYKSAENYSSSFRNYPFSWITDPIESDYVLLNDRLSIDEHCTSVLVNSYDFAKATKRSNVNFRCPSATIGYLRLFDGDVSFYCDTKYIYSIDPGLTVEDITMVNAKLTVEVTNPYVPEICILAGINSCRFLLDIYMTGMAEEDMDNLTNAISMPFSTYIGSRQNALVFRTATPIVCDICDAVDYEIVPSTENNGNLEIALRLFDVTGDIRKCFIVKEGMTANYDVVITGFDPDTMIGSYNGYVIENDGSFHFAAKDKARMNPLQVDKHINFLWNDEDPYYLADLYALDRDYCYPASNLFEVLCNRHYICSAYMSDISVELRSVPVGYSADSNKVNITNADSAIKLGESLTIRIDAKAGYEYISAPVVTLSGDPTAVLVQDPADSHRFTITNATNTANGLLITISSPTVIAPEQISLNLKPVLYQNGTGNAVTKKYVEITDAAVLSAITYSGQSVARGANATVSVTGVPEGYKFIGWVSGTISEGIINEGAIAASLTYERTNVLNSGDTIYPAFSNIARDIYYNPDEVLVEGGEQTSGCVDPTAHYATPLGHTSKVRVYYGDVITSVKFIALSREGKEIAKFYYYKYEQQGDGQITPDANLTRIYVNAAGESVQPSAAATAGIYDGLSVKLSWHRYDVAETRNFYNHSNDDQQYGYFFKVVYADVEPESTYALRASKRDEVGKTWFTPNPSSVVSYVADAAVVLTAEETWQVGERTLYFNHWKNGDTILNSRTITVNIVATDLAAGGPNAYVAYYYDMVDVVIKKFTADGETLKTISVPLTAESINVPIAEYLADIADADNTIYGAAYKIFGDATNTAYANTSPLTSVSGDVTVLALKKISVTYAPGDYGKYLSNNPLETPIYTYEGGTVILSQPAYTHLIESMVMINLVDADNPNNVFSFGNAIAINRDIVLEPVWHHARINVEIRLGANEEVKVYEGDATSVTEVSTNALYGQGTYTFKFSIAEGYGQSYKLGTVQVKNADIISRATDGSYVTVKLTYPETRFYIKSSVIWLPCEINFAAGAQTAEGTAPASVKLNSGDAVYLPANTFKNYGYSFIGWSDGTTTYQPGAKVLGANATYTAVWEANIYNVTFASVENVSFDTEFDGTTTSLETFTFKPVLARGYIYTAGIDAISVANATVSYNSATGEYTVSNVTANTSISIVGVDRSTVTVTYKSGEETFVAGTMRGTDELELINTPFTKADHKFIGWSLGGTPYAVGASYVIDTEDVVFEAVWQAYVMVTVNGVANKVAKGEIFTLPQAPEERDGYKFGGWTDGVNTYAAGDEIPVNAESTLREVWTAVTVDVVAEPEKDGGSSNTVFLVIGIVGIVILVIILAALVYLLFIKKVSGKELANLFKPNKKAPQYGGTENYVDPENSVTEYKEDDNNGDN